LSAKQYGHEREAQLKSEIEKAESAADTLRSELDKARKELAKIKEQWNGKIQKLHDKVTAKTAELAKRKQAHDTTKLDTVATDEAFKLCKEDNTSLKARLDTHQAATEDYESLRQKNEGLQKSLLVTKTNRQIETDNIERAVREATAPLDTEIKQLRQQVRVDGEWIDELTQSDKSKTAQIMTLETKLSEDGKVHKAPLDQHREVVESLLSKREGKNNNAASVALEKGLADETARSKRLEEHLGLFLAAVNSSRIEDGY
jgi:chromosome segregation ATPase